MCGGNEKHGKITEKVIYRIPLKVTKFLITLIMILEKISVGFI